MPKSGEIDHTQDTPDRETLLTEDEILAMPDEQYMNQDQIRFFRYTLEKMKGELLENVSQTTENLRETPVVPDLTDRATIEEEYALELRTRDREGKLLTKINEALKRLDDGSYGWCEETGEPIGVPRLLARPTTALSIEAQQRREIRQKLYSE